MSERLLENTPECVLRHGKIEDTLRVSLGQDGPVEYVLSQSLFKIINL